MTPILLLPAATTAAALDPPPTGRAGRARLPRLAPPGDLDLPLRPLPASGKAWSSSSSSRPRTPVYRASLEYLDA